MKTLSWMCKTLSTKRAVLKGAVSCLISLLYNEGSERLTGCYLLPLLGEIESFPVV